MQGITCIQYNIITMYCSCIHKGLKGGVQTVHNILTFSLSLIGGVNRGGGGGGVFTVQPSTISCNRFNYAHCKCIEIECVSVCVYADELSCDSTSQI